jgi:hypothetical protein
MGDGKRKKGDERKRGNMEEDLETLPNKAGWYDVVILSEAKNL